jgi:hypothetical protein
MARPSRATQAKRERERSLHERKAEKIERRHIRSEEKKSRTETLEAGVDPDLIGIYPGPQPPAQE